MSHRQILEAMTGLMAALFTALLSSNIVATALPTIIGALEGTQRQYTWVITASLLATTVSTPIWGKFSDLFNKKLLVQLSILVFVAGSVGAGFAHDVPFLIGCRVIQGLGMGGLTALTQSIMGSIIAPRERGRYSGYMGAVMAVSTVSGPLIGGVIVDSALGWRWCFFVCVPLAIISLFVLQATLKVETIRREVRIDYLGALLIAIGASLPLLWVTFAGNDFDWWSWQTAAYLVPSALVIGLAVLVELRVAEPTVPLRVLNNRTAVLVIIASVAVGIAMFGGTTFLGQYFQVARGYTPTRAGLMMIPLMVCMLISSTGAGQIISRTGRWKKFLIGGAILLLAGLAGLSTLDHTTPLWQTGIYMGLMGLGMGAMMQNLVLAVQNTVDVADIGAASATIAFFRTLGGAVGVSVLGAVLATRVKTNITDGLTRLGVPTAGSSGEGATLDLTKLPPPVLEVVRAAYGDATGRIFLIGGIVAVLALVSVLFIKEVPLRTTVRMTENLESSAGTPAVADPEPPASEPVRAGGPISAGRRARTSEPETADPRAVETGAPESGGLNSDTDSLDDPEQRIAVAALDVLTSAQDRSRQHLESSEQSRVEAATRIDRLSAEIDAVAAGFQAELDQIKSRLQSVDSGASLGRDGVGGDNLRSYEFGLLLNSQRTASRVTSAAREEAERLTSEARAQIHELEHRIETLRQVEQELEQRAADRLRLERS
ncbi:hypothetical protein GCM10009841_23790 [Microlunatus panaciterrae]